MVERAKVERGAWGVNAKKGSMPVELRMLEYGTAGLGQRVLV